MKINFSSLKPGKEYFLFLLPVYFVFHGFVENYVSVTANDVFRLIGIYLLATIILSLLFFFLFRSQRKTALFVFALMCLEFFFGAIHDTAKKILQDSFLVKYVFVLPLILIGFTTLAIYLYRSKRRFNKLALFLNSLLVLFILIDIPPLFFNLSKTPEHISPAGGFSVCDSCDKPDIYLIIADEYAGKQELNEIFHFDNSAFEQFLKTKGFHIIENSKSNYNYTRFSVASILSMKFLTGIKGQNSSKNDINTCYSQINKNSFWKFLRSNGYEIKNYSIFNIDDIPTLAPDGLLIAGSNLITSQTFHFRLDRDVRFNLVERFKIRSEINRLTKYTRKQNEKLYNQLLTESKLSSKKPRFIYTHLMMPHYPYYYDSKGKPNPLEIITEGNQSKKEEYIEYLQYCNGRFQILLNTILANSKKPPIIIFMGDHGWRHFTEPTDTKYQFMNLSSIYLPDKEYSSYYDGMSNINMFRILLNKQFHQNLSLLKDSTSLLIE